MSESSLSIRAVGMNPARELSSFRTSLAAFQQVSAALRLRVPRRPRLRRHETYLEHGTMAREFHRL